MKLDICHSLVSLAMYSPTNVCCFSESVKQISRNGIFVGDFSFSHGGLHLCESLLSFMYLVVVNVLQSWGALLCCMGGSGQGLRCCFSCDGRSRVFTSSFTCKSRPSSVLWSNGSQIWLHHEENATGTRLSSKSYRFQNYVFGGGCGIYFF